MQTDRDVNCSRTFVEKQREHFDSIAHNYYKARIDEKRLLYNHLLWSYFFDNTEFDHIIGSLNTVQLLFKLDKPFYRNFIGKKFSFSTLSLLRKSESGL